jgi:hypothetical protein
MIQQEKLRLRQPQQSKTVVNKEMWQHSVQTQVFKPHHRKFYGERPRLVIEFLPATFAKMRPFQNIKAVDSHVTRWDMHLLFVCLDLYSFF